MAETKTRTAAFENMSEKEKLLGEVQAQEALLVPAEQLRDFSSQSKIHTELARLYLLLDLVGKWSLER
jgi:hypothetical protein